VDNALRLPSAYDDPRMSLSDLPVLRVADATSYGLTRHAVHLAVSKGQLLRLGAGVVAGRSTVETDDEVAAHAVHIAAAQLRMRGIAAASHGSAALLHGIDRLGRPSGRVRLTRGGGRYRRLDADARLYVCGLPPDHLTVVRGVVATTAARTVMDLARCASVRSGVVSADSALRAGCTKAEFEAVLDYCRRWPGRRRALQVIALADGKAESPLESISRLLFVEWGVDEPELQVWLTDDVGMPCRVDFLWRGLRVVGEADGMAKYDVAGAGREEKRRQMALEDAGYEVVRWTWQEVWRTPERVIARLNRAFRRARRLSV
jgi:hypothetical protein